jgi:hypothetical protein
LVLWRTAQNSKSRLTLIPPKSGKINNLIMMNVNLYHVWGFEKFTDIEKLVIFEDFSSTDSIHSYENGAMLNILANTTANIKNIILVDMCLRTGNQTLRINPITKYISIQRCNLLNKTLIGEGLKHVFFSIQPGDTSSWIELPDNVTTVTTDSESVHHIKHFPTMMTKLQFVDRVDKDALTHIKLKKDCEIVFVKKDDYVWKKNDDQLSI